MRVEVPSLRDGARGVSPRAVLRVHFSGPVRQETLTAATMRLLDPRGRPVPAFVQADLTGGVATLTPTLNLKTGTRYTLELLPSVRCREGRPIVPFSLSFTTGSEEPPPDPMFLFQAEKIDDRDSNSCLKIGPDGCLYVADTFGEIRRYRLDPDSGRPTGSDVPWHIPGDQIVGMCFDPEADAGRLVLWISFARYGGNFSGTIARLELPLFGSGGRAVRQDVITGLPHDKLLHHQPNGIAFGPDGRLYQSVGGVATLGGSPNWGMHETPLTAAVIVADVRSPGFNGGRLPLNVHPDVLSDEQILAGQAEVELYATGFRNAYDLCWHSSGHLFTATNQNSISSGVSTPASPDGTVPAIGAMPHEMLYHVVEGKYYGHPNPSRGEYVLNGGNPTADLDPFEVPEYPVGVQSEPGFDPTLIYDLRPGGGNSANGMDEYRAEGPLRGRLLIAYFSGAKCIQTFAVDDEGRITHEHPLVDPQGNPIRFAGALDVAVHPETGRVYVADFGNWKRPNFGLEGAVWMLEPVSRWHDDRN